MSADHLDLGRAAELIHRQLADLGADGNAPGLSAMGDLGELADGGEDLKQGKMHNEQRMGRKLGISPLPWVYS